MFAAVCLVFGHLTRNQVVILSVYLNFITTVAHYNQPSFTRTQHTPRLRPLLTPTSYTLATNRSSIIILQFFPSVRAHILYECTRLLRRVPAARYPVNITEQISLVLGDLYEKHSSPVPIVFYAIQRV